MYDFRSIGIYFDTKGKLIGIPSTMVAKTGIVVDLDEIYTLSSPYEVTQLEEFILFVLDKCYTQIPKEVPHGKRGLVKYLSAKSYADAVKLLGFVGVRWIKTVGYMITPAWKNKKMKSAIIHMEEKAIIVPSEFEKGELGAAVIKAMSLSPIELLDAKP